MGVQQKKRRRAIIANKLHYRPPCTPMLFVRRLFRENGELGAAGVVSTVLFTQGTQTDVAGTDNTWEENRLRLERTRESAAYHGFTPRFPIGGDIDFIILDMAVRAILTRGVGETFDGLQLSCVEIDPMGVGAYRDAPHAVPEGAGIAVGKGFGATLGGFDR